MRRSSEFRFVDLFYLFVKVHHLRVDHAPYSCLSRFNAVKVDERALMYLKKEEIEGMGG